MSDMAAQIVDREVFGYERVGGPTLPELPVDARKLDRILDHLSHLEALIDAQERKRAMISVAEAEILRETRGTLDDLKAQIVPLIRAAGTLDVERTTGILKDVLEVDVTRNAVLAAYLQLKEDGVVVLNDNVEWEYRGK